MLWLSYETNIGNLLLNAVALECILCVDELIYEAIAPARVRKVCEMIQPGSTRTSAVG